MYVVRNVFKCKPGRAKDVIEKFKATHALIKDDGMRPRVLVDEVAGFWTVVAELEVDDLAVFNNLMQERASRDDVQKIMAGYTELVESGYREIFRVA